MVDSVKGMPAASAAWAARISPSACCIPVRPTGASAIGSATSRPIIVVAVERFSMSTATRWRRRIRSKSVSFSRKVCSVQEPDWQ